MAEQATRLLNIPAIVNQVLDGDLGPREFVVDVLTEVRHVAASADVDFDEALAAANLNFVEEVADERADGGG